MPFAYFGAKHGLAAKYPPPAGRTIVEPFAGSAGYSCRWIAHVDRVVLVELDPQVCELWRRVLAITDAQLEQLDRHLADDTRTADPMLAGMAGGSQLKAALTGRPRAITPRMRADWPKVRRRIQRFAHYAHRVELIEGPYTAAPDIVATWHIDPPYQPLEQNLNLTRSLSDQAGNCYRHGAAGIDYAELAAWCRSRRGLVMVCEQSPAAWLPFSPLARQLNGAGDGGSTRTEVIWRNDAEQGSLFDALGSMTIGEPA